MVRNADVLPSLGRGVPPQGIRKPLGKSKCGLVSRKSSLHNRARIARTMRERVSAVGTKLTQGCSRPVRCGRPYRCKRDGVTAIPLFPVSVPRVVAGSFTGVSPIPGPGLEITKKVLRCLLTHRAIGPSLHTSQGQSCPASPGAAQTPDGGSHAGLFFLYPSPSRPQGHRDRRHDGHLRRGRYAIRNGLARLPR